MKNCDVVSPDSVCSKSSIFTNFLSKFFSRTEIYIRLEICQIFKGFPRMFEIHICKCNFNGDKKSLLIIYDMTFKRIDHYYLLCEDVNRCGSISAISGDIL